jgi:hypothetical protein
MRQKFKQLDLSQLRFIERGCDLCGNKEGKLLHSVVFLEKEFYFVRCPNCGMVYQNPLLDKESRKHLYETIDYWGHKHGNTGNSTMLNYYSYLEEKDNRLLSAEIRIKWIESYLPKNALILDIGCSDGLFVSTLCKAGYRALGIDVSETMISYGRENYGVKVYQGDFEDDWPFTEPFDAVTCYATMSNFINPSLVYTNIRKHLRRGGYFFFNFGDCDRLVSQFFSSRLYLYRPTAASIYSKKTVLDYCQQNDLQILEMFTDVQVVPFARLLGFFRIPGLINILKILGMEEKSMKMTLPTGYAACAVLI